MKIQPELITKESNLISSVSEGGFSDSLTVKLTALKKATLVTDESLKVEVEASPKALTSDNPSVQSVDLSEKTAEEPDKKINNGVLGADLLSLMSTQEGLIPKESIFFNPEQGLGREGEETKSLEQPTSLKLVEFNERRSFIKSTENACVNYEQKKSEILIRESPKSKPLFQTEKVINEPETVILSESTPRVTTSLPSQTRVEEHQDGLTNGERVLEAINHEEVKDSEKADLLVSTNKSVPFAAELTSLTESPEPISQTNLNITPLKHQENRQTISTSESLTTDFKTNLPKVSQVLRSQVAEVKEGQTSTLKLTLQPEKLGQLEVILQMEDGKVTAKFLVENQKVKQLFEQNMPKLEQSLVKQDLQITKMEVVLQKTSQETLNFSGQFSQQQSQQEQRQKMTKQGNHYKLKEAKFEVGEQVVSADSVDILV